MPGKGPAPPVHSVVTLASQTEWSSPASAGSLPAVNLSLSDSVWGMNE